MQRRGRTVRVEPPFSVVEWIEMYKNNKFEVLGYKILGPGSDESWLYSKDQVPPKLSHRSPGKSCRVVPGPQMRRRLQVSDSQCRRYLQ